QVLGRQRSGIPLILHGFQIRINIDQGRKKFRSFGLILKCLFLQEVLLDLLQCIKRTQSSTFNKALLSNFAKQDSLVLFGFIPRNCETQKKLFMGLTMVTGLANCSTKISFLTCACLMSQVFVICFSLFLTRSEEH